MRATRSSTRSPASATDGIVVTDQSGRVVYANAAYLKLVDAVDADDVRPVERVFVGDPLVSEAIYRLAKASREGRQLQEEVRVPGADGAPARWLRFRVRPLAGERSLRALDRVDGRRRDARPRPAGERLSSSCSDAIDFLDHAPAGFFSVDPDGNISYLNATLASWLDYDLAQVGSGGLKLADIVVGDGAALLAPVAGEPGDVKTEVHDLDLKTRGGRTVPVRLYHKVAFAADGTPGASRTLVLNRAREEVADPAARRRGALRALLPQHPDGDRDRRQGGQDRARERAVRAPAAWRDQGRGVAGRGTLDPDRRRRARSRRARSRDRQGGGRAGRHRAGRRRARRRGQSLGAVLRLGGRGERAARARLRSSTRSRRPRCAISRSRSRRRRRWIPSASSPAASRTTSTTCSPPS